MEFKLTKKQADKIANAIIDNNFSVSGTGRFDISRKDTSELIMKSFESGRNKKVNDLYNRLFNIYMR